MFIQSGNCCRYYHHHKGKKYTQQKGHYMRGLKKTGGMGWNANPKEHNIVGMKTLQYIEKRLK